MYSKVSQNEHVDDDNNNNDNNSGTKTLSTVIEMIGNASGVSDQPPAPPPLNKASTTKRSSYSKQPRNVLESQHSQTTLAIIFSIAIIMIASIIVFFNEEKMLGLQHETLSIKNSEGNEVDENLPAGVQLPLDLLKGTFKGDLGDGVSVDSTNKECENRRAERLGHSNGPPVQYVHIPKAGGTTIQDELAKWTRRAGLNSYHHDGDHEKEWQCPISRIKHAVVWGHRGFGYCKPFLAIEKAMYVVVLRDPVSRFISEFDYFMSFHTHEFDKYRNAWGGRELNDIIIEYNKTLSLGLPKDDPKLKWPHAFKGLSKQQTSFLCGYDCIGARGMKYTDEEKLERALENLRKCDVVTIMDKLDEFIPQMRMHVNWIPGNVHKFPHDNSHHGKKSVISDEAKQILLDWASIDNRLYQVGVQIHEKKTELAHRCLKLSKQD